MDVSDPDEKSLMTYVSSLYDVFPEVPPLEQTLLDNVSSLSQYAGSIRSAPMSLAVSVLGMVLEPALLLVVMFSIA